MGSSAGGHLSLMCGLVDSSFIQSSPDPIDRLSSKVQAVVSFSPVSDFFNWDNKGNNAYSTFLFKDMLTHVLEFRRWDGQRKRFDYVKDEKEIDTFLKLISPTNHASPTDAAILLFHGEKDELVPIHQSQILVEKLRSAGLPYQFEVKKDGGHGWQRTEPETKLIMDWFDKYLK
jgi:acetyl esterase/lipase